MLIALLIAGEKDILLASMPQNSLYVLNFLKRRIPHEQRKTNDIHLLMKFGRGTGIAVVQASGDAAEPDVK